MTHKAAAIVYPHQLWDKHPAVQAADQVFLIEDPLFFNQYRFHIQKLVLHRSSMSEFMIRCQKQGKRVERIESRQLTHSEQIGAILKSKKIERCLAVDPTDQWLKQKVTKGCLEAKVDLTWLEDSSFLTPADVMHRWADQRKHYHFTNFYIEQRKRLGILVDAQAKPIGGKWTFDTDNRKRLPKGLSLPALEIPRNRASITEAKTYVKTFFPNALGASDHFSYAINHDDAVKWLDQFIEERLTLFGDYEDAISRDETFLFHSVLTPMLNIGLLTPKQIIEKVIAKSEQVPLNSLEGFLRQVIGWREFIRLVYIHAGSRQRTTNTWKLSNPLPAAFYNGSTGIVPFDQSIKRTLKYAYCHHIERLMVLGNFMLLCDTSPDAVYQWFMEMFIDSYDWVMVPNVYGMSQHADGGLMTTKPYISGSAYILKMSDYPKGDWCGVWDALYWRFVDRERKFFSSNPRMRVMVSQLERMGKKLALHHNVAERFLNELHR